MQDILKIDMSHLLLYQKERERYLLLWRVWRIFQFILFSSFQNVIKSANTILDVQYEKEWSRIRELTGHGMELMLQKFDKYIAVLAESQHDTYTSPFEIVTSDLGWHYLIIVINTHKRARIRTRICGPVFSGLYVM